MEKFDVVVIGGGPGGYPAAIRAAQLGASVALIEKELLGGVCLNWGCIPTKTLIASADLYARLRRAGDWGLKAAEAGFDYAALSRRKEAVVERLRSGVAQLLKAHGVAVYSGAGAFLSRQRLAVRSREGETALEAGQVIVASGSESVMPAFIPRHERIVDSRGLLAEPALPASLIVLGGGVIGCEFACLAAQLGASVTVVELLEDILTILDPDVRREVRRHMEQRLGIRVLTGQRLERIAADAGGVSGRCGEETLRAERLLVAVGRRPVTAGLELERAGLAPNAAGFIETDEFCRTRAAGVYAVGDVTGGPQFAHAATAQGLCAAENLRGPRRRRAETVVPACIYTAPEVGSVGLTEQAAREKALPVRAGRFAFAALGRALAAGEPEGFVKWVAHAETDQLLGAQAVGPHATELIAEAALAIRAELTAEELGRTVHCHPTFAEAWMEAAHALHGRCVHAPPRRAGR